MHDWFQVSVSWFKCYLELWSLLLTILRIQDPKLLAALQESRKRQAPYAGAFLLKDEQDADPSVVSGSDTEKIVYDLKGKELFRHLHEVGTLAQVHSCVCSLVINCIMPSLDSGKLEIKSTSLSATNANSLTDI